MWYPCSVLKTDLLLSGGVRNDLGSFMYWHIHSSSSVISAYPEIKISDFQKRYIGGYIAETAMFNVAGHR